MMRMKLPDIVESAKKRPLGFNPETGKFIYYDEVKEGVQKLIPIDKLGHDQLLNLAIERIRSNEPNTIATLNGEVFNNDQQANEVRLQTKTGKQIFESDINYLKFYLSQFPAESFEK